jgi:glycosyltransferase involved in cell wall biosynthesis
LRPFAGGCRITLHHSTSGPTTLINSADGGLVREVIVIDGGSTDGTAAIGEAAGVVFVVRTGGRGYQLLAGAHRAKFSWLLFLHSDTVLEAGWDQEATRFMAAVDGGKRPPAAAAFRFGLDDDGVRPRILERLVALRCRIFRLPYGDQGLLIPKALYAELGGYSPLPLMEDVDFVRRLRRRRIAMLQARAVTDAGRFREDGYVFRSLRNLSCLALYRLGVSTVRLERLYDGVGGIKKL